MNRATIIAVAVVVAYALVFFVFNEGVENFAVEFATFLAPVLAGSLTLYGVALTVEFQKRISEESAIRSEKTNLKIYRLGIMPTIECGIGNPDPEEEIMGCSEIALDGDLDNEAGRSSCLFKSWVRLSGDKPAKEVEFSLYCGEFYESSSPMVYSNLLTSDNPEAIDHFRILFRSNDELSNNLYGVLRFRDYQGNRYWKLYDLSIGIDENGEGSRPEISIFPSEASEVYCERDISGNELRAFLLDRLCKEKTYREREESFRARNKKWAQLIPNYEEAFNHALREPSMSLGGIYDLLQSLYPSLKEAGVGGFGFVTSLKTSSNDKRLYFDFVQGTHFYAPEIEFETLDVEWKTTVEVNVEEGFFAEIIDRKIVGISGSLDRRDKVQEYLIKRRFAYESNRLDKKSSTISRAISRIRYAFATQR